MPVRNVPTEIEIAADLGVTILTRTTAIGYYHQNFLGLVEKLTDHLDEVPDSVAISEAVNLVRDLSTDDSPAFVNGVLANIERDKSELTTQNP